jgi:hypothetical protein
VHRSLALAALLALVPTVAGGTPCATTARCSCVPESHYGATPAEQVAARRDRASAVLLGRVVAVELDSTRTADPQERPVHQMVARVVALDWWKGVGTDTVSIVTKPDLRDDWSCELRLEKDEVYLIFATAGMGGRLYVSQCRGTRHADGAASVIPLLGTPMAPRR